jgi:hypothetical protein
MHIFDKEIKAMVPKRECSWLSITTLWLIWALLMASPAAAGSMKTDWVRFNASYAVLGEMMDYEGWDIKADSQGRVYNPGSQTVQGFAYYGMASLVVYDSQGNKLYDDGPFIGVPPEAFSLRLTLDTQGNVYFSGNESSTTFFIRKLGWEEPTPGYQHLAVKWQLSLADANGQPLGPLAVDGAGNVYAGVNYKLYKFAPDGSSAGAPWPVSTLVSNVTGMALVGDYVYITGGNFTTERYHKDTGVRQWTQTYPPPISPAPGGVGYNSVALAVDGQGNVFVTGTQTDWNVLPPSDQIYTVKYDPNGSQLWVTEPRGPRVRDYHNSAAGLVVDDQGNAYVAGTALNPQFYRRKEGFRDWGDIYTVKYAPDGTMLWEKYFNAGTGSKDSAVALARDSSGNLVVTGTCSWALAEWPIITEPVTSIMATVCYSPGGQRQWLEYYEQLANRSENEARALAVRGRSVYVTGRTRPNVGIYESPEPWHWVAIKYSAPGKKELIGPRP